MSRICCTTFRRELVRVNNEIVDIESLEVHINNFDDNNRASICEYIKPKLQEERQWDWFTAETCEAQYKQLYNENVKSSENPLQQIIQSLKSS